MWDDSCDLVLDLVHNSGYWAHHGCDIAEFLDCFESEYDLFEGEFASECDFGDFPDLSDLVGVHCASHCVFGHLGLDALVEQ